MLEKLHDVALDDLHAPPVRRDRRDRELAPLPFILEIVLAHADVETVAELGFDARENKSLLLEERYTRAGETGS